MDSTTGHYDMPSSITDENIIGVQPAAALVSKGDYVILDVIYYAQSAWRRKSLIGLWVLLCVSMSIGYSYFQPKLYESVVKFMPPSRPLSGLLLNLGHSSGDEYRAMLTSRSITDDVIQHQQLLSYFKTEDMDRARVSLRDMVKIALDSNNFLTVTVKSKEPQTSVRVANEFYAALIRMSERLASAESEHRLKFMTGPLQIEQAYLNASEDALRDAQMKTGLVAPETQTSLGVQQVAALRERISSLQTQLAMERVGSTDQNPQIVNLRTQIQSLQSQIQTLESKNSQANSPANLPELSLEVLRQQRDVRYHTATLEALSRAIEVSQVQDSYVPSLSLIDPAILQRSKVSPSRKLYALVGTIIGLLIGFTQVLSGAWYRRWLDSPRGAAQRALWDV